MIISPDIQKISYENLGANPLLLPKNSLSYTDFVNVDVLTSDKLGLCTKGPEYFKGTIHPDSCLFWSGNSRFSLLLKLLQWCCNV